MVCVQKQHHGQECSSMSSRAHAAAAAAVDAPPLLLIWLDLWVASLPCMAFVCSPAHS